MEDLMSMLSEAAAAHDWLTLSVGVVLVAVPVVLKALGKSVPVLDQILAAGGGLLKSLRAKRKDAEAKPEAMPGLESVVKVEEKK